MSNIPEFPGILPSASVSNYNIQRSNPLAVTRMSAGPIRMRQRFTTTQTTIKVKWLMSDRDYTIFESFFVFKIKNGSSWFNMNILNSVGHKKTKVRFLQPYSVVYRAPMWEIQSILQTADAEVISEDSLDLILKLGVSASGLDSVANKLHSLVHTTLPRRF